MLYEKIMAFLTPIQTRYNQLTDEDITAALAHGTSIALPQATAKVEEMKRKVGFMI